MSNSCRFVIALLLLSSVSPCGRAADTPPMVVTIGFAAPLAEFSARQGRNAAQLAIEEINKGNPSINGRAVVFELLEQDDKADPRISEFVARTLANSKAIGVVGHWTSATTGAAAPIYHGAGLAQISPFAWSRSLTQKSYRTIFQIIGSDDLGLALAADYLVGEQKLKRVLVLDDGGFLGISMADYFSDHVKAADGEIIQRMSISGNTSDFNQPLLKARESQAELIFFSGRMIQSDVLARNLQRFHLQAKLLLTGLVVSPAFLKNAGDVDSAVLAIVPSMPLDKRPGMSALQKKYAERYGSEMLPFAVYFYDSVQLLAAAAKKANSLERAKIVNALHEIRYSGISANIAFDANGALLKPGYTLYSYERKGWTPVRVFTGK
ncbi:branched-chain amino acid ABC transporter substrate-binding protein [Herbaspirillum lusitanum]|uniref:branched-chain amino acid ABC transporter substrate-binding protein n=1 Tax=Herbaspirillum lusitanum TaxID=213312 RepID=UPI0022374C54|nr:branched-chain amino acid ABC transporter substrate-binding protein [Herbaspirillum lusitanum]